jgi:glycosyltransferase involved in cell wall biosynthesis
MPKVSIIIPSYNREETIGRAIKSVLQQGFNNFELIVVDDGSDDRTVEVVQSFSDSRISIIQHAENQGANAARNSGIDAARGELISFLDSDDEFHTDYLEEVVRESRRCSEQCGGIFTSFRMVQDGKVIGKYHANNSEITQNYLSDGNRIGTLSCTTFKTEVFDDIGEFDDNLPASQDFDFYLRVLNEYTMRGIDRVLITKYLRGDSIGSNLKQKLRGFKRVKEKHGQKFSSKYLSNQQRTIGRLYAERGDMEEARRHLKKSIILNKKNYPAAYLYILTLFGKSTFNKGVRIGFLIRFYINHYLRGVV